MRNRLNYLAPLSAYLGALCWIFGILVLIPLIVCFWQVRIGKPEVSPGCFIFPAVVAACLGIILKRKAAFKPLDTRSSMLLCALGWIVISGLGALPFWHGLNLSYLDAYFESVSGFTTTGITMLEGLDHMPRSILLWRAMIQWVGGLGILTFFLLLVFAVRSAHSLFSAESHKISARRPVPGLAHTLRILWSIYIAFTAVSILALILQGLSMFDAACHSMTTISTGGFSPYDASIDCYRQAGYRHFAAIEATLTVGMLLGGMNFLIHYRMLTGEFRALWDNLEMRLFWCLIAGATLLVALNHWMKFSFTGLFDTIRYSLFQVVSIITTTGFATRDIGSRYFPAFARQIFLVLMVVGGCAGSTSGGIKVIRIGVLFHMVKRQLRRVIYGRSAVMPVMIDGKTVDSEELRRIGALFFAWIALLAIGAGITALLSNLGAMESASGMFSALGNIGPCYISRDVMTQLHPAIKVTYIIGMLAGRLEIIPILMLFYRRTWK